MDLAIRYLLHGQPDEYDSTEKLFIVSRYDSLWEKIAYKVLEITHKSWKLIDSSLSESISEEKFEQIGIIRLTPSEVIKLLKELSKQKLHYIDEIFAQISLSDSGRQEILNEIGKNIDNKELWRLLPLHKSSENKLVSIKQSTYAYLENPDYKFKLDHVKVALIIQNINILHYPEEGWISQWSPSAEIKILLEQPEPHNYTESILRVYQSSPDVKNEYHNKLKNTQWLRLSNDNAIAPVNILTYPEYLNNYKEDLIKLNKGYYLQSNLKKHLNYNSISNLFTQIDIKDTLINILNIVEQESMNYHQMDNEVQPVAIQQISFPKLSKIIITIIENPKILQGDKGNTIGDLLGNTKWLITKDKIAISPFQVIDEPDLNEEIEEILISTENNDLTTKLNLHDDITSNKKVIQLLSDSFFIKDDQALKVVGDILSEFSKYYLGAFAFSNEFPLKDALVVFKGIDNKILPAWSLIEKTTRIHGKEKCSRYILTNLLTEEIQESKLIDLLGWLSNRYESTDMQAIKIYNQYLTLAVGRENFGSSILPHILLINRLGQWKSPSELCVNMPNIAEQYILDEKQQEIIQGYLDEGSRIEAEQAIDDQNARQAQENIITLQDYFQDWHSHVYSEAIGAFICLIIGGNQELRKFTRTLLRNRDIDLLTERLLGSVVPRSFLISESRGETQEVKSLISDIFFHADKRTGKTNNIFVNNLDRYTNRLVLAHLNPLEYNREELSNLLKESARLLIQNVYQVSNANEPLDRVWGSLIKSEQLDVAVTRNVILDSASSIIKFLSVHNQHEGIKQTILELNESISRREEYRTYNRDYQNIDHEIYSLKQQLGNILEDNSPENTAPSIVLQAVRDKIKQFGYKLTNIPFEIFQNADDALVELEMMAQGHSLSSDRLKFIIEIEYKNKNGNGNENDTITMMHWGRPINCFVHPDYPLHDYRENGFGQDLEKMLSFNYSDKRNDDNNVTGKFGLGFKSVHLICKQPLVFSNRIAFRIVGGLLPSPLLGNSNSTIKTQRDQLEQKLQEQNQDIFDGTAISLQIDPSLNISPDDTIQEFERLVGLLLIFAKKITQFKCIKDNNQPPIIWNPINLLSSSSIQIGEVKIGVFTTNALCLTLSNGKFVITLDKKEGKLRASLPNDIANIWVTAPTQEKFRLKFIINASFDINTGRSEVLTNQKNNELSHKLGSELGEQLCQLFALTQNNWNEFIEALQITGTTQYEFWELIWNELAINSFDNQAKLIRVMMLGNKGMGYFLSNCPALPNGLWGEYQQLVLPSEIIYIVENILKDQTFFNHVFQWERVKSHCNPSTIIHGNEWDKYRQIIECSPVQQQLEAEELNLLQVIKWQLLNSPQADISTANQVGQLINKTCLEKINQYGRVEYQKLIDWLNKVKFLNQSNNYHLNSMLLDVESQDDEERLQSAFAPDEYVLNQQYGNTGKDFFYACRSNRIDRKEEERLFEWIKNTAENKRSAAIEYLEHLKIVDDDLLKRLLLKLEQEQVSWLKEFFPPKQDIDGTTDTTKNDEDGNLVDTRDPLGKNPKWGEPGEALAGLFYNDFCQKNPSYSLEQRGGYGFNHDFLLRINGREIKIEVKTTASKSFRLTISEWNELTSRNENYELFVVEHSGGDVKRVIRIQNAWNTLQKALANLKEYEDITSESQNIESLIGLKQEESKNVVILNWDRLIDIYGNRSDDENITFYSCNAKLVYGQRSVNPSNPTFTKIIPVNNAS
jgi:hypothetical protein